MALYPGAVFKPTSFGGRTLRNKQGRGILHVAVSNARSLPPWNSNTWHFYVAKDGYCEQYVDTEFRAATSGAANDDAIGIETAGGLGTSAQINSEPWTPQQMARLADIMRWESQQPGGAPLQLLPDAQPGRRGWGPHRLGIKHSAGPRPGWWQPGSELWSSVLGKECPGTAKVNQIPQLIEMARGGAPLEDDDVSAKDVWDYHIAGGAVQRLTGASRAAVQVVDELFANSRQALVQLAGLQTAVNTLAAAVASGRDDLTAEELKAAVAEAIQDAGAALRAAEKSAPSA